MSRCCAVLRKRKLRSLTVGAIIIVAGTAMWFWLRNPLNEFVDRDLRKLDDHSKATWRQFLGKFALEELLNAKSRLQKIIDCTLPEKYTSKGVGFQPWYLWRYQDDGEPRFLLLLVQQRGVVASGARVALQFLSSTGKPLSCIDFTTENYWTEDIALRWEPIINERVLEIRLSVFERRGQEPPLRLIYSFLADRSALIHVEGGYFSSSDNLPPHRTAEECVAQLNSDRPSIVLEALSAMRRFDRGFVLVEDLRYDPALKEKATKLSRSPNPWIRRAAADALYVINH